MNFAANRLILLKYRYDLAISLGQKGSPLIDLLVLVLLLKLNLVEASIVKGARCLGSYSLGSLGRSRFLSFLLSDRSGLLSGLGVWAFARWCC